MRGLVILDAPRIENIRGGHLSQTPFNFRPSDPRQASLRSFWDAKRAILRRLQNQICKGSRRSQNAAELSTCRNRDWLISQASGSRGQPAPEASRILCQGGGRSQTGSYHPNSRIPVSQNKKKSAALVEFPKFQNRPALDAIQGSRGSCASVLVSSPFPWRRFKPRGHRGWERRQKL